MGNGKQRHLSQSVTMTGLDSTAFQTCIDNLRHLQQLLSRQVPDGAMEPFTPGQFSQSQSITLSTRYFTSRREDPFSTAAQFARVVDPKGILASMTTEDYFHGTDNKELYYSLMPGTKPAR